MNDPNAGFVRFKGSGQPGGYALVATDVEIQVCQQDGTWIPLRGVCSAKFDIRPDAFVTAEMVVEVGELNLESIRVSCLVRATWWRRFLWWARRKTERLRK